MAGVQNNTARQFNIRHADPENGNRITVRIKPGFNVVEDSLWSKVACKGSYAEALKKASLIDYGSKALEAQAELPEKHDEAKTKVQPPSADGKKGKKKKGE